MPVWVDTYWLCEPEQVSTSLALSFLVCKMEMLVVSALQGSWREEMT